MATVTYTFDLRKAHYLLLVLIV